jgi:deoxyribodipyrimidine photo-lyase
MKKIIYWFRRDLRLRDNPGLSEAARLSDDIIPIFVIDPSILSRPDCGPNLTAFFFKSLQSLATDLEKIGSRLILLHGNPLEVIPALAKKIGATHLFHGRDYEPFAKKRDAAMRQIGERIGLEVRSFKDLVVWETNEVLKDDGGPYTVFTPYSRRWKKNLLPPLAPTFSLPAKTALTLQSAPLPQSGWEKDAQKLSWAGFGENAALQLLEKFLNTAVAHYSDNRNLPAIEGTSRLSPHLRSGNISPRQIIHAVEKWKQKHSQKSEQLSADVFISEIIWRDFYQSILDTFPHVIERSFRPEYDNIEWPGTDEHFHAWCEGRTGYPIVDAAMRQLVATGWMHNRLRMIVAMFLTKDLHIHWQRGEAFFMRHLADGDCAANNGGWQWSASTGTDAAPYFRIFSPLSQSEKFDPEGNFLRTWLPELSSLDNQAIHAPHQRAPLAARTSGYPEPLVDHSAERLITLQLYKSAITTKPESDD